MDKIELQTSPRTVLGKKVKQLRRQGVTPVNLYGPHTPSLALQVETRSLRQALAKAGKTDLINLRTDGKKKKENHPVLVRGIQVDPRTRNLLHVDFYEVKLTEKVRAKVPIHFAGQSPAVGRGGVLLHLLTHVEVECLPQDMPHALEADVSGLEEFSAATYVREIAVPQGVVILTDPEGMVAKVEPPRKLEEAAAEVEAAAEAKEPQMEQKAPPEEG